MKSYSRQIPLIPEFQKFISASSSGRRLMVSGKKVRSGTVALYRCAFLLLQEFEAGQGSPLRIQLLHRASLRMLQKEKNYWMRFFKQFSLFLYRKKRCHDQYVGAVFKIIKLFFQYLEQEKGLPIGSFHKRFRVPVNQFSPVILTPAQLKFLITNKEFENALPAAIKKVKDIFVFGCTVALRYQDLFRLQKNNVQYLTEGVFVVLHTQKTGSEIRIPLPEYAQAIVRKYMGKTGNFVLPRLACSNLNLGLKRLIKHAGWIHPLPKIRHRQGEPVEIYTKSGETLCFFDHVTSHTMRRTAITTLLLLGVDENTARRISGHAPGSKEFYRYVVVVQEYLNAKVKEAHLRLLSESDILSPELE